MTAVPGLWAGIGYDVGGEVAIGIQYGKGTMFCLSDPDDRVRFCTFRQEAVSVGLGLGGSFGESFIFGINIAQPADIDGAEAQFDFSLDTGPVREGVLYEYFYDLPEYLQLHYELEEGIKHCLFTAGKALELANKYNKLKQVAANQKALRDIVHKKPALIMVPLPVGFGLRISAKYKFTTTDVISWGTRDFSSRNYKYSA